MENEIIFSNKMQGVQGSAIREILKMTQGGDIISFAGGLPAPEMFPVAEIKQICNDILEQEPVTALQYSVSEGYPQLKDLLWKRMQTKYNIGKETDDILIVSGGQQGADLTAKAFLNEGDGVICENPSFVGVLNTLRTYGAKLFGISTQEDGMDLEAVEKALKDPNNKIKLIYTIPTFQNPSGITMSLEKRKTLLALAEKYNVFILEDNPYSDLRFEGEDLPTLKSMDENGRVIYVASMSKILSPGLRIAWMIAPKTIMGRLVIGKQATDVHTNIFAQMIAYRYFRDYDADGKIAEMRELYGKKCRLMLSLMDKHFPKQVKYTRPQGGLFIWGTLPEGFDSKEVVKECIARKVVYVPGVTFMADDTKAYNSFRLNYSTTSVEDIEKGIKILGEVFTALLK